MDETYYRSQLPKMEDLTNESAGKQESFFQQILIVSSGIPGILVSLHSSQSKDLCIRLVFAFAILLLALCVLTALIAVYDHSRFSERIRQAFRTEYQNAMIIHRRLNVVTVDKKRRTLLCEKTSLLSLISSLVLLSTYTIMTLFN